MTPEQELELLIEEQRRDDTFQVWPERHVDFSLDAEIEGADGGVGRLGDAIGVTLEGEIISFLPRKRGHLLNASFHGTENGYSNHKCRCARCTDAHRVYYNERRARLRRSGHDKISMYSHGKCRCASCRRAWRTYKRRLAGFDRYIATCAHCNGRMKYTRRDKVYCGEACRQAAKRLRLYPRCAYARCLHCDEGFKPKQRDQIYCSVRCRNGSAKAAYRARLKAAA